MAYKHPSGRIQHRARGGQFRRSTLADFGVQVVTRPRICSGCGHEWRPIVADGICPRCDSQVSLPAPTTDEEQAKLAEYRAFGPDPDPRTINEQQRLYDWLNSRGLFD